MKNQTKKSINDFLVALARANWGEFLKVTITIAILEVFFLDLAPLAFGINLNQLTTQNPILLWVLGLAAIFVEITYLSMRFRKNVGEKQNVGTLLFYVYFGVFIIWIVQTTIEKVILPRLLLLS